MCQCPKWVEKVPTMKEQILVMSIVVLTIIVVYYIDVVLHRPPVICYFENYKYTSYCKVMLQSCKIFCP